MQRRQTEQIEGKPIIESPERLGVRAADTYDEAVSEVLDVHEAERFWAQAEAAAEWRRSLPEPGRAALLAAEAEVDAAFGGIE